MSYQDIKNLIGLTYEENGKDYKIVGIKDVTEDYITLDIKLVQEEKMHSLHYFLTTQMIRLQNRQKLLAVKPF